MKKLLLGGMLLTGFIAVAQKEVTCSYTSPATKEEFKVSHVLKGEVYYEGTVSNNAGMTEFVYADFDGTNIKMAKYTINKKDNSCFSIYEYTIPKKSVNWKFNDMFGSASKKETDANGVVEVTLGGGAFGGNIAKEKVILPMTGYNYKKDVKTALGKFQNEAKFKEFFRKVTAD